MEQGVGTKEESVTRTNYFIMIDTPSIHLSISRVVRLYSIYEL